MADRENLDRQVAQHLNDLGALGLLNLSNKDNLRGLIEDQFWERPLDSSDAEENEEEAQEERSEKLGKEGETPTFGSAGPSSSDQGRLKVQQHKVYGAYKS